MRLYGVCRSHEYYGELLTTSENKPQDITLPSSGKCENDPLLQEQMANVMELYDIMPVHSTEPQSRPMDVDASVNEGNYNGDDLYKSPM